MGCFVLHAARGLAFAVALAAFPVSVSPADRTKKVSVIVDTDMGSDDWLAMLYLLRHPAVAVKAITVTGTGLAHTAAGTRNALSLLQLAGRENSGIVVAGGSEVPLDGFRVFPRSWRSAADALLGIKLAMSSQKADARSAVELLIDQVESSPDKVTIVALGPLTNLAEAIRKRPALPNNIKMIYVMGGALKVSGNVSMPELANSRHVAAEWNFYADPLAAQEVVRSGARITLVPLDATNRVRLTARFAAEFKARVKSPVAAFIDRVLDINADFIASGECYFWDQLAAAAAADPLLCTYENVALDVVVKHATHGDQDPPQSEGAFPSLVANGGPRRHFDATLSGASIAAANGRPVSVCITPVEPRFVEAFVQVVNQ